MTYDFQRRKHRAGDMVDGDLLTEDFALVAERVGGRLRAHQLEVPADPADRLAAAEGAFHALEWAYEWVTTGLGAYNGSGPAAHGNLPTVRTDFDADADIIPNHFAWKTLHSFAAFVSGTEALMVDARVNHCWAGFDSAGGEPAHAYACADEQVDGSGYYRMSTAPSIQFGIRVDGELIYTTGIDDDYHRAHMGIKAVQEITPALGSGFKMAPGFISAPSLRSTGPGQPLMATHFMGYTTVGPGSHQVDIMMRRVPRVTSSRLVNDDTVAVCTRAFLLHRMKVRPVPSRSLASATIADFDQGNPLSSAELNTNTTQTLKTAANALTSANLDDRALRSSQVLGPIAQAVGGSGALACGYDEMVNSSSVTVTSFAESEGGGSTFVVSSTAPGTDEWVMVENSAGTGQLTVAPSAGTFGLGSDVAIKLFGRILVKRVKKSGSAETDNCGELHQVGFAAIYYKVTGGNRYIIQHSIVPFSRAATMDKAALGEEDVGGTANDWLDVPLFAIADDTLYLAASNIDHFGIVVSTGNFVDLNAVELVYSRANLSAISFKL